MGLQFQLNLLNEAIASAAPALGAAGVQLGTAFLTCPEAATAPICKQLLLQEPDRGTTVSQVSVFQVA